MILVQKHTGEHMYIKGKKRIKSVDKYLDQIKEDKICIGFECKIEQIEILYQAGFMPDVVLGQQILPIVKGSTTAFNANGKGIPQKHLPKETCYRIISVYSPNWHGNYTYKEFMVPYHRYPRIYIPAPNHEVFIRHIDDTHIIISSHDIAISDKESIKVIINMFLELFKECFITESSNFQIPIPNLISVPWTILPKGVRLTNEESNLLDRFISTKNKQKVDIKRRLDHIINFNPSLIAIGNGGFNDYIVFGFEDHNLFVFESNNPNNATYIFIGNWVDISKRTKAEIISGNLHKARLIHTKDWDNKITQTIQNLMS